MTARIGSGSLRVASLVCGSVKSDSLSVTELDSAVRRGIIIPGALVLASSVDAFTAVLAVFRGTSNCATGVCSITISSPLYSRFLRSFSRSARPDLSVWAAFLSHRAQEFVVEIRWREDLWGQGRSMSVASPPCTADLLSTSLGLDDDVFQPG